MRYLKLLMILAIFIVFAFTSKTANAYSYPIYELGNCRDAKECHLYCEAPMNHAACWSYTVYGTMNVLGDETPETKMADLGITFPIAELDGCASLASCKAYCSNQTNRESCSAFAELRGLTNKASLIEKAQAELGCNSLQECKTFCEQTANKESCSAFAKRFNVKMIVKNKSVELAKTELGCTSKETCRTMCGLPENQTKCESFARRIGKGDTRKEELVQQAKQKLGCTSFEECKKYCQDKTNRDKCRNFGSAIKMGVTSKIMEKGNCTTAEECRKACEANPDLCPNFPKNRIQNTNQLRMQKSETDIESEINQADEQMNALDTELDSSLQSDLNSL